MSSRACRSTSLSLGLPCAAPARLAPLFSGWCPPNRPLILQAESGGAKVEIFISWSGQRSRAVAELLKNWIKMVVQGTDPWISTQDLESGSLWLSEINQQLGASATGIVCITQENKTAPWIHFEAGALAKGLTKARVCTFLIDLKPEDIAKPSSCISASASGCFIKNMALAISSVWMASNSTFNSRRRV